MPACVGAGAVSHASVRRAARSTGFAAEVGACAAPAWVGVCEAKDLPLPGAARSFRLKPQAGAPPLEVALVRSKAGELYAAEDALPPLGQRLSGPHAAVDGRVLRASCPSMGTHFDLRTGEVLGPWCPGPPPGSWRTGLARLQAWLLTLFAWLCRRLCGPRRLITLPVRVEQDRVEVCITGRLARLGRAPALLQRLMLSGPARRFPAGTEVDMRVKRISASGQNQCTEFQIFALAWPQGRRRWPLRLFDPPAQVGKAFVRLPDVRHQHPQMASLVRQTLGRSDLKDSDVRIAVWVAQFVATEARGLGIDMMLLAKIMDLAHSNGYTHLLFVVDNRSPELHDMLRAHYESQGCVAIPEDNPMGLKRAMLRPVETPSMVPATSSARVDERQEHTLEACVAAHGISLATNAFVLAHGYVSMPLLFEFAREVLPKLVQVQSAGVEELSSALGANVGPLSVVLRTAQVLGFVRRDPTSGAFSPTHTPELEALCEVCAADSNTPQVLQQVYEKAAPPFRMSSGAASLCLRIWREHRAEWHQRCTSPAVRALLDGVVLAPMLTSLVYFHRWDEVGFDHGSKGMEAIECPGLDAQSVATLDSMLREIGVGGCSSDGTIRTSSGGALALQRVFTFFAATSYCPLLANLHHVIFEDAAWGFAAQELGCREQHVNRTLNVVGSGAQHKSFFRDFCKLLGPVFSTQDVSKQPALVIDTGCGDGTLLAQIYSYVRDHTPRGQLLDRYPLTVVGVDFNEASREATAANLAARSIPHIVLSGDIGSPSDISAALAEAGADPSRAIHVRSFLDHDRPFIPPAQAVIKGSARDAFIDQQFVDVVHLDKSGTLIKGSEVYQSLVEHFERWGNAVDGSHGLCLLEVMVLDVLSTRHCFGNNVSFHFDIEEALSRQYLVPPVAFHLALAEAGLFSQIDYRDLQTYPETGDCLRILSQHVTKRPFRVRLAELEDVPQLLHLEEVAVARNLRADHATVMQRLLSTSCEAFVVEGLSEDGPKAPVTGKLLAALYTTRIASEDDARSEICEGVGDGPVMQIVALSADPEGQGAGALLRDFALQLARLDPSVRSVVGITRCEGWRCSKEMGLEEYVTRHQAGELSDKILGFHTLRGAKILRLLPGIRPQDLDNAGTGVLIRYEATAQGCRQTQRAGASPAETVYGHEAAAWGTRAIEQAIWAALAEVGLAVEPGAGAPPPAEDSFAALGVDSLDLAKFSEQLTKKFGVVLPTSLLLEHPSVSSLVPRVEHALKHASGPGGAGDGAKASGLSKGKSADLVRKVLEDLGFEASQGNAFLDIGLDSIDLARVKHKLAESLGLRLPDTLCLDYPSPSELAAYLDTARADASRL